MSQQNLAIAGNETTAAKHDDNGCIVSVCCEEELVMDARCAALDRRMRREGSGPLAPAAVTWRCPRCGAVALVDTELVEVCVD